MLMPRRSQPKPDHGPFDCVVMMSPLIGAPAPCRLNIARCAGPPRLGIAHAFVPGRLALPGRDPLGPRHSTSFIVAPAQAGPSRIGRAKRAKQRAGFRPSPE